MGFFSDRESIARIFNIFIVSFANKYEQLGNKQYPTLLSKLPFIKYGVYPNIVYGKEPFLILSRDSKQPPFAFVQGHFTPGTWDESEFAQLSSADCIDDIVPILDLEQILYFKRLDSLELTYLAEALGTKAAEMLAEQILEENIRTLQPTFEDAIDRMKQAYELLFCLENRLRMLVENKLKEEFGDKEWWLKGATHNARAKHTKRQQDPRRKWHLLTDASPLNLVDFDDLHDIIVNKNAGIFAKYIEPLDRFSANMKSLEIPRNMVAHNDTLPADEYYAFRRTVETLLRLIEPNLTEKLIRIGKWKYPGSES